MTKDLWHYPHMELAQQILGMFATSLSSALIFFAPRRMGKTEFLRKDVTPLAEKQGWHVFYFSFLDVGTGVTNEFTRALAEFAEKNGFIKKTGKLLEKIKQVSGEAVGVKAAIRFATSQEIKKNMKQIMEQLAERGKILLLLDEVQILALDDVNINFIAALRTMLDIHKDSIKVIFTGSSQVGLRRMFSEAKAPFFHFGQNLNFPAFDRGFTDHLVAMFEKVTRRKLNRDQLWNIFLEMQSIPQLARSLVEKLALNPNLNLETAKNLLLTEIFSERDFVTIWNNCAALERLLLQEISTGTTQLFSNETRGRLARLLGIDNLEVYSIQSSLRVLQRKNLIGRLAEHGSYFIDDLNFKGWLTTL